MSKSVIDPTVHRAQLQIPLATSGYSSEQHTLIVLFSADLKALKRYVRERKYERIREGDHPGQVYAYGLKCLRYMSGDEGMHQAVCVSTSYWDV